MSTTTLNLTPALHQYLLAVSLREAPVLAHLRRETAKQPGAVMQIAPEQGQLLQLLVELMGANKTLDIGTFTGYSALAVALALPMHGKVVSCDVNAQTSTMAKDFWQQGGVAHKIDFHLGPAQDTLQQLLEQGDEASFDFAFIDADKAGYPEYYESCLQLLRIGGLIAIDNVLWEGNVINPDDHSGSTEAIREFNERIHHDERVTLSMVPIADGVTLARKR